MIYETKLKPELVAINNKIMKLQRELRHTSSIYKRNDIINELKILLKKVNKAYYVYVPRYRFRGYVKKNK